MKIQKGRQEPKQIFGIRETKRWKYFQRDMGKTQLFKFNLVIEKDGENLGMGETKGGNIFRGTWPENNFSSSI